jgi:hypothetical protein
VDFIRDARVRGANSGERERGVHGVAVSSSVAMAAPLRQPKVVELLPMKGTFWISR